MNGSRSKGSPVRVDHVLSKVLKDAGVLEQVRRMDVLELWPEIVGEQVARVTQAKAVNGTALIVEVKNSAWLMELNMMRGDVLLRVNEHMADLPLDRVVFVLAETR